MLQKRVKTIMGVCDITKKTSTIITQYAQTEVAVYRIALGIIYRKA